MRFFIKLEGDILGSLLATVRPRMYAGADQAGQDAIRHIKEILGPLPPRHGKMYPSRRGVRVMSFRISRSKGNKRVGRSVLAWYRASAEGEAPAPDTEAYRNSWNYRVVRKGFDFDTEIYSHLWDEFGRRLEFGGGDSRGVYIAPRPHVRVMLERVRGSISLRAIPANMWSGL